MASIKVPRVKLGSQGLEVSQQGLGCMGMSFGYGPPKPEQDMIELIHKAVESGVTFIDTADVYGPHTNELLVGKAIKGIRDKVELATKFGNLRENGEWKVRGDPAYVRAAAEASLKRLDVEYIDLYYQHRVDANVPIEITVGEMKKLVEEGKVKYLGLSEASPADIRRAHAVHPITAVQVEWSLWSREIEADLIPTCRELGIAIVPYSPLGRGFFSGVNFGDLHETDRRKHFQPRFEEQNLARNRAFFDRLVAIGAEKGCTPGQLALAWLQHQGRDVVPIPGTTKTKNLQENIGALGVELTPQELKGIQDAVPLEEVSGNRYPDSLLATTWLHINSPPLSSWTGAHEE